MRYRRCHGCAMALPICAGQLDPLDCDPARADRLADRSKFASSAAGWPGIVADEPLSPRPTIDRSKPRLPLGVALGSPNCLPCSRS